VCEGSPSARANAQSRPTFKPNPGQPRATPDNPARSPGFWRRVLAAHLRREPYGDRHAIEGLRETAVVDRLLRRLAVQLRTRRRARRAAVQMTRLAAAQGNARALSVGQHRCGGDDPFRVDHDGLIAQLRELHEMPCETLARNLWRAGIRVKPLCTKNAKARRSGICARRHYSHFFQRKNTYGPIAAKAISVIARG